jgi:hypothetical protein
MAFRTRPCGSFEYEYHFIEYEYEYENSGKTRLCQQPVKIEMVFA